MRGMAVMVSIWLSFFSGCDNQIVFDVVSAKKGTIYESFAEPAHTRLAKTYLITMPIAGRIGRIDLEPGDRVMQGQTLVHFDRLPLEQAVIEARARMQELEAKLLVMENFDLENTILAQSNATVEASQKALQAEDAKIQALQMRVERTSKELERLEKLKSVAQTQFDDARLSAETSLIDLRQAEFERAAFNALFIAVKLIPTSVNQYIARRKMEREEVKQQLLQVRAQLARAEHELKLAVIQSPIDGVVLERYHQGDGNLLTGTSLLLLGNLAQMEVVAEVLTQDALRLSPGMTVQLEPAAGKKILEGVVKLIEPAGFTKLSSLGVEQQRVRVIVTFREQNTSLGCGYQVQARFLTGFKNQALLVPRYSILQSPDQSFFVWKVTKEKLQKQPVQIGLKSDLDMEIVAGLTETDQIVAIPDTTIKEGMKIFVAQK